MAKEIEFYKAQKSSGLTVGSVFSFIAKALVVVISTPIFLGLWLINFIKTIFGSIIMWVIGKVAISLLTAGILEGLFYLNWITQETGDNVMNKLNYHLMGSSEMGFNVAPEGAIHFFSYPKVEFTIIIVFAIITATMMTIDPDGI